jgi:Cu+-exporting ATPase
MQVEEESKAAQSSYRGTTYYFCSPGCKQRFDVNPQQYAGTDEARRAG